MAYHYDPDNKFGYKDTLPEDHPEKVITGVEFDDEFKKIAGAFAIFDPDGDGDISIDNIDGLQDALDKERQERIEADADLQGQIDALDPDGDRNVGWDEIENKPTEFPPAAHNQDWNTITNTPSEYPPEAHTHEQGDIDGLEDRLESIEDSITSGGGFVDAPNDGQLYGRQSEAWAVVPSGGASSWDDLADKPTEFPPAAHNQGWDTITDKPDDYPPSAHGHAWDEITGKPTDFPPASHNHDGVYQPVGDYIEDANSDGKQYARQDGAWSEIVIPDGGTGSSVHIGEAPPADPQEGQQWMEVPASGDATMWIYDGAKWLEQPGGKDGADGTDGVDGLWTDNGDTSISYTDGNVGIGTDSPDSKLSVVGETNTPISIEATGASSSASTNYKTPSGEWFTGVDVGGADGSYSIWNNAKPGRVMTITADSATTVRQDLDNPYTGTIDADTNMSGLRIWNNATATDLSSGAWFKTGGHWSGVAGSRNGKGGWGTQLSFYTHGDEIDNLTQATERMRIDADGLINMAGGQVKVGLYNTNEPTIAFAQAGGNDKLQIHMNPNNFGLYFWDTDLRQNRMALDNAGGLTVYGNIYKQGGTPVSTAADLIEVLHTLREATKDESTLEGLRDSIGNAVGGLIEKFEAMQSTATQEIDS